MRASYGNIDVVAPSSAPMFVIVALPVALIVRAPGPRYSAIALVAPATGSAAATIRITPFGAVHPESAPARYTAMWRGYSTSHGRPAITSTASAPPTPTAQAPRPPAFGVWESVPMMSSPGNAYCSRTTWWMMPAPGPQNPAPYLAAADLRKS